MYRQNAPRTKCPPFMQPRTKCPPDKMPPDKMPPPPPITILIRCLFLKIYKRNRQIVCLNSLSPHPELPPPPIPTPIFFLDFKTNNNEIFDVHPPPLLNPHPHLLLLLFFFNFKINKYEILDYLSNVVKKIVTSQEPIPHPHTTTPVFFRFQIFQ